MRGNNDTELPGTAQETPAECSPGSSVPGVSSAAFLVLICFSLLAFLLYANSLKNEFVFDDIPLIAKNYQIRPLANVPELLGWAEPAIIIGPCELCPMLSIIISLS